MHGRPHRLALHACILLLGLALAATAAQAQGVYRVVGPDGAVTFTDRPPDAAARVEPLVRSGAPPASPALPPGLREVAARFPVVLYTVPQCAPCDRGGNCCARAVSRTKSAWPTRRLTPTPGCAPWEAPTVRVHGAP